MTTLHGMPYINYYTIDPPQYIILYKSLLNYAPALGLSLDAVYLYSHLCALANLSAANGLTDSNGDLFVICTRVQAAKILSCSPSKVTEINRQLVNAGLIYTVKQTNRAGCNVAPHIFIRQWNEPSPTIPMEDILAGKLPSLTALNVGVITGCYYRVPTALNCEKFQTLSVRAKILYSILLDRMTLSIKHNFIDNAGYWCSVKADQAECWLQCTHSTLSKTYGKLINIGLVQRARVEPGCPEHTYLRPCWEVSTPNDPSEVETVAAPQSTENSTVNCLNSVGQLSSDFPLINQINSKTLNYIHPFNFCAPAQVAVSETQEENSAHKTPKPPSRPKTKRRSWIYQFDTPPPPTNLG